MWRFNLEVALFLASRYFFFLAVFNFGSLGGKNRNHIEITYKTFEIDVPGGAVLTKLSMSPLKAISKETKSFSTTPICKPVGYNWDIDNYLNQLHFTHARIMLWRFCNCKTCNIRSHLDHTVYCEFISKRAVCVFVI